MYVVSSRDCCMNEIAVTHRNALVIVVVHVVVVVVSIVV